MEIIKDDRSIFAARTVTFRLHGLVAKARFEFNGHGAAKVKASMPLTVSQTKHLIALLGINKPSNFRPAPEGGFAFLYELKKGGSSSIKQA